MSDRIIDAADARKVDIKERRRHPLIGWVVSKEDPDYPGKVVARLVTGTSAPYTLVGDTLEEIHQQLPPDLERADVLPSDPSHVAEVWFTT